MTILAVSAIAASQASADTANPHQLTRAQQPQKASDPGPYSFGMRVGGYGFRQPEGDRRNGWDDCRMNGLGAFAERTLGGHGFIESGIDLYFSESFPLAPEDGAEEMDRLSGLITAAGGLRMFPHSRVSGFVQLGAGVELTKVAMGDAQDSMILPVGFIGLGGDIRFSQKLRGGMNMRAYLMGHFPHDHGHHHEDDPLAEPTMHHAMEFNPEPEAAAQVQFYLKYSL